MKLAPTITFAALLAPGSSAAVSDTRQADKVCSVSGTSSYVNCRAGPGRDYATVRGVQPAQQFSVQCMRDGEAIDGEKAWGYIPAWHCWLAMRWTDLGCKRALETCST
ncbi:hypothetical protein B0T26DRAFT_753729 [Lasiosphaeria miniovina]|uniref:SH3 domain-containing protein n=1 Tax=Lasiosphaeria miniovina TaxID=1954250 RepID=A0AA40AD07_9PEZI|nr:uncharacterized protein B0T26DRAFT_753729 [Lasiosphaeria miniovina]KAK0713637.1 hypothetical protein B0T26DRAFT_753729 [Lasiosphaeria miniovina]